MSERDVLDDESSGSFDGADGIEGTLSRDLSGDPDQTSSSLESETKEPPFSAAVSEIASSCTAFRSDRRLGGRALPPAPPPVKRKLSFSEPDDDSNIVFTGEVIDGIPQIKAASLTKLVERLTFVAHPDPKYMQAFMLTYRSFTTPLNMLDMLTARFDMPPPLNATPAELSSWKNDCQRVIRLRVFNVLKTWLKNFFYDFLESEELRRGFLSFLEYMRSIESYQKPATQLKRIFDQRLNDETKKKDISFSSPPPTPHLPVNMMFEHLTDLHPEEVARQLTLIEFELYRAIKPWECLGLAWSKKEKEVKAPNILKMIERFNQVSKWIATEVVKAVTLRDRTLLVMHLIEIADHCKALNNFNAMMEILSGLQASAVYRLRHTFTSLPKSHSRLLEEMQEIMAQKGNYRTFRAKLKECDPPCIPYLGMYLTDLTFIEDGNADLQGGLISFYKRRLVSTVIRDIQQYQQKPYCLETVGIIRQYLLQASYLSDDAQYQLSLQREARGGALAKEDLKMMKQATASNLFRQVKKGKDSKSVLVDPEYGELQYIDGYKFYERDIPEVNVVVHEEQLIAATVAKLVERLTDSVDPKFFETFMMTLPNFTSPSDVLDLLIMRYHMPHPRNPKMRERFEVERLNPTRSRILAVIKKWIIEYTEDFRNESAMVQKLMDFMQGVEKDESRVGEQIMTLVSTKIGTAPAFPTFLTVGDGVGENPSPGRTILHVDPDEVAMQLLSMHNTMLQALTPRSFLSRKDPASSMYHICRAQSTISLWTSSEILTASTFEERAQTLARFLRVAKVASNCRDFISYVAILKGVEATLPQIKRVWAVMAPAAISFFSAAIEVVRDEELLRTAYECQMEVPTIPCFVNIEKRLKALDACTIRIPNTEMVNWDNMAQTHQVFEQVEAFQKTPFDTPPASAAATSAAFSYLMHATVLQEVQLQEVRVADPVIHMGSYGEELFGGIVSKKRDASPSQEALVELALRQVIAEDAGMQAELRDFLEAQAQAEVDKFDSTAVGILSALSGALRLVSAERIRVAEEAILRDRFPDAIHMQCLNPRDRDTLAHYSVFTVHRPVPAFAVDTDSFFCEEHEVAWSDDSDEEAEGGTASEAGAGEAVGAEMELEYLMACACEYATVDVIRAMQKDMAGVERMKVKEEAVSAPAAAASPRASTRPAAAAASPRASVSSVSPRSGDTAPVHYQRVIVASHASAAAISFAREHALDLRLL